MLSRLDALVELGFKPLRALGFRILTQPRSEGGDRIQPAEQVVQLFFKRPASGNLNPSLDLWFAPAKP
jgi:hypothetical protein